MSHELSDNEYVQMLVEGNASIFWHSIPRKPKSGELDKHIQEAIYRGVKQALNDRAGFHLPDHLDDLVKLADADCEVRATGKPGVVRD